MIWRKPCFFAEKKILIPAGIKQDRILQVVRTCRTEQTPNSAGQAYIKKQSSAESESGKTLRQERILPDQDLNQFFRGFNTAVVQPKLQDRRKAVDKEGACIRHFLLVFKTELVVIQVRGAFAQRIPCDADDAGLVHLMEIKLVKQL